ncbi:MAG: Sec-independent protein translocase protein TatB [Hyphomicrobiaceae bacterium]
MFDIGWSELLVIAVVAVIVVGPKDLPRMLRSIGQLVGQIRRMANEFTRQFDEALRESELHEIRDSVSDIAKVDPLADFEKAVDRSVAAEKEAEQESGVSSEIDDPGAEAEVETSGPSDEEATASSQGENGSKPVNGADKSEASGANGSDRPPKGTVPERAAESWKAVAGDDSGA